MTPNTPTPPDLPPDLRARLLAAGVTDDISLQTTLQHDPTLRADFEAFLQENLELLAAMQLNALLQAFAAVQDGEQMLEFWRGVPAELEQPLIEAIATLIDEANRRGDGKTADRLAVRLEEFRSICQAAAQQQPPPVMVALRDFVQAGDEVAAAAVFSAQRALLHPYEAQRMMDALAEQPPDDTNTAQRIMARRDLLRRLRGAASVPLVDARGSAASPLTARTTQVQGTLYQAEHQYFQSAFAEGGSSATVEEAARQAAAEKAQQEEAARQAAAEKAQQEEADRQAAAEKAQQEAAARQAAAEKAQQEAAARQAAAEKAQQEEADRQAAEEKAQQEAAARQAAEEKAQQEEADR
ncbi:MAG: hypothetical protein ACKO9F_05415, partial [Caldilinea sp.]